LLETARRRALDEGRELSARSTLDLAREYMYWGDFAAAEPNIRRYLELNAGGWPDERAQAVHLLAGCLRAGGRVDAAIEAEEEAAAARPDWPENALGLAESCAALGRWRDVRRWATLAARLGLPASTVLVNPARLRV